MSRPAYTNTFDLVQVYRSPMDDIRYRLARLERLTVVLARTAYCNMSLLTREDRVIANELIAEVESGVELLPCRRSSPPSKLRTRLRQRS